MLRTPWLGIYGSSDSHLAPGEIELIEQSVRSATVPADVLVIEGVGHDFDIQTVDVPPVGVLLENEAAIFEARIYEADWLLTHLRARSL
jgi:dienelactone hydrolase